MPLTKSNVPMEKLEYAIGPIQAHRAPVHLNSCPGKDWPDTIIS